MTSQMIIRLNPELKSRLNKLAKAEGKSTSQIVRDLIEDYIHDHDIGAYIDNLWDRIGSKMTSHGFSAGDVKGMIEQVRSGKT